MGIVSEGARALEKAGLGKGGVAIGPSAASADYSLLTNREKSLMREAFMGGAGGCRFFSDWLNDDMGHGMTREMSLAQSKP